MSLSGKEPAPPWESAIPKLNGNVNLGMVLCPREEEDGEEHQPHTGLGIQGFCVQPTARQGPPGQLQEWGIPTVENQISPLRRTGNLCVSGSPPVNFVSRFGIPPAWQEGR